MTKTKHLSVRALYTERPEGPNGYGLVEKVEKTVAAFLEENGGTEVSHTLVGTVIDPGAGNPNYPETVFGHTLVSLVYEPGAPKKKKK